MTNSAFYFFEIFSILSLPPIEGKLYGGNILSVWFTARSLALSTSFVERRKEGNKHTFLSSGDIIIFISQRQKQNPGGKMMIPEAKKWIKVKITRMQDLLPIPCHSHHAPCFKNRCSLATFPGFRILQNTHERQILQRSRSTSQLITLRYPPRGQVHFLSCVWAKHTLPLS